MKTNPAAAGQVFVLTDAEKRQECEARLHEIERSIYSLVMAKKAAEKSEDKARADAFFKQLHQAEIARDVYVQELANLN
jgi:hypothetical protein